MDIRNIANEMVRLINILLPKTKYVCENEVKTKRVSIIKKIINGDGKKKEGGIVKCHKNFTKKGDNVVVVGGGDGVTAVHAAKMVGVEGKVTIYEGGNESLKKTKRVIKYNEVGEICEAKQRVVGSGVNVYGGSTKNAKHVDPENIPQCDVLELDCEGAEVEIVRNLDFVPRVLIAELHPWLFDNPDVKFKKVLNKKNLEICDMYGHDGVKITEDELGQLLEYSKKEGKRYLKSGARWPVVVAAHK